MIRCCFIKPKRRSLIRSLVLFLLTVLILFASFGCSPKFPGSSSAIKYPASTEKPGDRPGVTSLPGAEPSAFDPVERTEIPETPGLSGTAAPTDFPTDYPTFAVTDPPDMSASLSPDAQTMSPTAAPTAASTEIEAVFLGVKGYGSISAAEVMRPGARVYRFRCGTEVRELAIRNSGGFPIQNMLMEGHAYRLELEDNEVVSARLIDAPSPFSPAVSGVPGRRTLKNFLQTALMPLGKTLYVYGGGWDWQDEGSSVQATTIGASGCWAKFFRAQNADYQYKNSSDPASSYYPFGGWNEYYYAGLDCSGYIGWALYNTLETSSGRSGYVCKSRLLAKSLADERHLGTFSTAMFELGGGDLRPGDIVSMKDHVWICLGRCADGSIVILHSTPSKSITGQKGGGVQLSALNPSGDSRSCEAYRLASYYQERYFPAWTARYPAVMKSFSTYVGFQRTGTTGVFRWSLDGNGLADPEGYANMSAAQILADIFGE